MDGNARAAGLTPVRVRTLADVALAASAVVVALLLGEWLYLTENNPPECEGNRRPWFLSGTIAGGVYTALWLLSVVAYVFTPKADRMPLRRARWTLGTSLPVVATVYFFRFVALIGVFECEDA